MNKPAPRRAAALHKQLPLKAAELLVHRNPYVISQLLANPVLKACNYGKCRDLVISEAKKYVLVENSQMMTNVSCMKKEEKKNQTKTKKQQDEPFLHS